MNFAHPRMLWLLLVLVPALSLFLWWSYRRKQALIRQFVQSRLLAQLTIGLSTKRLQIRSVLLVLSVIFLLLTLARPQWGFTWEETAQRGRDIIIAIDASKSMLAADLPPSRLQRAKYAALDLMKLARQDRFALVAFAGTAFLQCPLTMDDEAFRQSIDVLEPSILPQGGTAISQAIEAALTAFEKEEGDNHKIMVLFTDGEDHQEGISNAVKKAAELGLRIFTVGVGTPGGEVIRIPDQRGQLQFLRDEQGNVVKSRLNEALLKEIANQSAALYLPLQGANTMELLYEKGLKPLPTTEFAAKLVKRFREQYIWPLAIAILLLVFEVLIPDQNKSSRPASPVQGATGSLKTAALIFLLSSCGAVRASPSSAQRMLNQGNYREALAEYNKLLEKKPEDLRLHYNGGVAAYQAGEFDQAYKNFQNAAAAEDLSLQQKAYYNMGNALYRLGEHDPNVQSKIASWEQAVKHYESAQKLNSGDVDAGFNRELVLKRLEELKNQQQQQQQQDNKKGDQKEENKDNQNEKNKSEQNEDQQQEKEKQEQQPNQENQQQQNEQPQNQAPQNQTPDEQQQQNSDQKKPGDEKPEGQPGEPGAENDPQEQFGDDAKAMQLGQMTPAQAKQLLDAQKDDEKALIFLPQKEQQRSRTNPILKDW